MGTESWYSTSDLRRDRDTEDQAKNDGEDSGRRRLPQRSEPPARLDITDQAKPAKLFQPSRNGGNTDFTESWF